MPEYTLPYGKNTISLTLPDNFHIDVLEPSQSPKLPDLGKALTLRIQNPINKPKLSTFPRSSNIAITINDKTRPVPNEDLLPPLLDHLEGLGFHKRNITFFIASGTHTPMPLEEFHLLLPQTIHDNYEVVAHDCDNSPMRHLGFTQRGTPIEINAKFLEADIKIVTGNIEPHHFMGFSGGAKSAVIGLASRKTINRNHAMITDPNARSGLYESNPMRQDLEEIGKKIENMYAYNSLLNQHREIVEVLFGDAISVMKNAIPLVRKIFNVRIKHSYDMVIVSPGGHPKDINLYQSQKAITHAAAATKDGGWVVLLAACPEGSGSQRYEDTIRTMASHQAVLDNFHSTIFSVGAHKAFQIARDAIRVNIVVVSEMSEEKINQLCLSSCSSDLLNTYLNKLLEELPDNSKIAIMPMGTTTMTQIEGTEN